MKSRLALACLAAIALPTCSFASDTATQQYFALYMQGGKIGHAFQSRTPSPDGKVTTVERVEITMARGGIGLTAKTSETCVETADGRPLSFEAVQDLGMMTSRTSGTIQNGKLTVTTEVAGEKSSRTMDWPAGAVMSEGLRLAGLRHGLKEGSVWKAKVFPPSLMEVIDANVAVGAKRPVDLLGRVVELTELVTTMNTSAGAMVQTAYVNDNLETLKMTTNAMGMPIEMVACPQEFALAPDDEVEFFSKVTVKSPSPLSDVAGVKAVTYHIWPAAGSKPVFPATDTQSVKVAADGTIVLKVSRPEPPPAVRLPYTGSDPELVKATKRSQYVESDDPCVVALAKQAVGSEKDAWQAAKKIEKFVSQYVADKNLSVGYGSAAEVARSRSGDCSEHAVLVAAMCRAVGIPARLVAGLVYADSFGDEEQIFGPHAWAEVNIAGKWYGLDATGAPRGFGPDHIAVASGDGSPSAFLGIINTIGNFTITKLEIAR
jgi:hypothetical protein